MNKHHTLTKQKRKAGLLSIIPGLGQIANQQLSKGLLFLAITGLFAFELCVFGIQALTGLMTLGSVPGEDHSLFMLIEGTLQLIVTMIFLMFYIFNIHDSRKTAAMKAAGLEVNTTAKDMICHAGDKGFPYLFTLPAYIMMVFVIIFPVLVTLFVALTNYDFYHIPPNRLIDWVGFKNFLNIFFLGSYRETFVNVLGWTVIWTICATTLQIILGIVTALFVNQDFIKGKRIFRMIFLFPWAVPAFITIMSFSNMFNDSIGAVNAQVIPLFNHLPFVELPAIAWKTDPFWTKTALIMIQTWLGFPYIYVMVTGVLQAIPGELYEAAKIDGATFIQRFRHITFPMILFATAPVMITQYTFNFNNFSIIYLFNEGGPGSAGAGAGSTDILISWIYKLTTGTSPQYSVAAAVTLLISFIVIGISLIAFKKSNAFGNEEVM
ncbi:sugar ABC transporter permease [Bacillus subtilis subsp. subtilis]|uniref:Maltodextrin transport system permease protein MdxF n=5 Tax=Bacillus subtilis TaxID=1423 RepID=MDXF_BACSU|nr:MULTISPECIES: maltodextrin ABC transporter permease MdxF [Bacillales]NP_391340.1 maltodextrin ABC transport system (permease) [Bacillus subtilis subsp. subtilis str. 168]O06990.1 RecName: Full=Maltodextrin transport system permease protein MdxF [Bacillus subtilis subsp. subtilis str. 168]BAM55535.1 maltodextrin ABC transport system permease [Bacillus subtilis BEST7613]AFQ59311.1 Maltodextrin ABC transport system (permease) [Bacillus subtilis QB928]AGG62869.1 maltodextrin ABC transport syste